MHRSAGDGGDFVHVFLNDCGKFVVELVDRFASLEVDVGVLGADFADRFFRADASVAELLDVFGLNEFCNVFVRDFFDFVKLMGGAETVEEREERNLALEGCEVGDERHVHFFLDGSCGGQRETGVPACHDVGMVAEDCERLTGERTRRHMEDAGEHFARDLIHIRDHEEQTLRSGVGACQRTCGKSSVHSARGAGFGLHFHDGNFFSPDVFLSLARPLVNVFAHCRRRSNGINGSNFAQRVSYMRGGVIAVYCDFFPGHQCYLLNIRLYGLGY